ncbi:MAG: RsmB/NOP family class I SAM-dependent RNA methyltransferase [Maricaulaceae bacterium]|nr:RsmB/NOP family class I SAM-dependent RNA methyltransferase [Maricaulaceae bacterium]
MRDAGRIAAAIEILQAVESHRVPAKDAVRDWGRTHRFAGSGDRAWISGLVLDALRRRASAAYLMGDDSPRALVLGTLALAWGMDADAISAVFEGDEHAPPPLTPEETKQLAGSLDNAPDWVRGDYPEWAQTSIARAFGADAAAEGAALSARAPVDLRLNALKADPEKALAAVQSKIPAAQAGKLARHAIRIEARDPRGRAAPAESIPAYGKGWVEVQDEGSQIAALAAAAKAGEQVLDFCAGAGGKTLALAAAMGNAGQVYAWDHDWRRLRAIWPRLQRAGARNVQVRDGRQDALADLACKMDCVLIDAPCTGAGTWRRRPDAKWRVTEAALHKRMAQQDEVLARAAEYVKPGGRLVYVTCSIFPEENGDRVAAFLAANDDFRQTPALDALIASGGLAEGAEDVLRTCADAAGALLLTPRRADTDGFFIAVMQRA